MARSLAIVEFHQGETERERKRERSRWFSRVVVVAEHTAEQSRAAHEVVNIKLGFRLPYHTGRHDIMSGGNCRFCR